jgi:hypothetical protein
MKSIVLALCISAALLCAALAHWDLWQYPQARWHEGEAAQSYVSAYDVGGWKRKLDGIDRARREREGVVLQAVAPALGRPTGQRRAYPR